MNKTVKICSTNGLASVATVCLSTEMNGWQYTEINSAKGLQALPN